MLLFFFFKQKTAYEMRISDWSSDVCSADLPQPPVVQSRHRHPRRKGDRRRAVIHADFRPIDDPEPLAERFGNIERRIGDEAGHGVQPISKAGDGSNIRPSARQRADDKRAQRRSEEHTSELQSLMRISYAVFCLKKKKHTNVNSTNKQI